MFITMTISNDEAYKCPQCRTALRINVARVEGECPDCGRHVSISNEDLLRLGLDMLDQSRLLTGEAAQRMRMARHMAAVERVEREAEEARKRALAREPGAAA